MNDLQTAIDVAARGSMNLAKKARAELNEQMILHLYIDHCYSVYAIAKRLSLPRPYVQEVVAPWQEDTDQDT